MLSSLRSKHILVRFLSGRSVWDVDNPEFTACISLLPAALVTRCHSRVLEWRHGNGWSSPTPQRLQLEDFTVVNSPAGTRGSLVPRLEEPGYEARPKVRSVHQSVTCNFLALSSCERMKENFFGWGFGCANQQQWSMLSAEKSYQCDHAKSLSILDLLDGLVY